MSDESAILRLKLPDGFTFEDEFTRTRQIKTWLDVHLAPILQSLAELRTYYGMDFARSGDLSAIAVLVEEQNLRRRCPVLIELRNVPFKQQQQILFALVDGLKNFQGGAHDARGNGQMLAELARDRYGSRIESVMTADSWYLANFPKYRALLEEQAIVLPRDSDVLGDHRVVRVENGIPKIPASARFKGSDGEMRHGDTAIAFCLAAYAAMNQSRGSWDDAVVCGPRRVSADFNW
jgi:phage FluMu gp28-like protein